MIKPLEDVIERMRRLPDEEQAVMARFVLHELEEDEAWRRTSEAHGSRLAALVEEIVAADARGECADLDVERL
ncbi:MAG: hypothetical protein ACKON7_10020 [Planctomycetaceae bacterium]